MSKKTSTRSAFDTGIPLDPAAILAFHRATFGSARMDADGDGGDEGDGGENKVDKDAKTFTQAELDRIIADRLARAKPADYDDLKAAAKRLADIEAANASELDKAVAKARAEGAAEVQSAANSRLVASEARAQAATAKFRNPALAIKAIDLSTVKVADDGTPDAKAIKDLLDGLAKDNPYLLDDGKVRALPDKAQGAGDGNGGRPTSISQVMADRRAQRDGNR